MECPTLEDTRPVSEANHLDEITEHVQCVLSGRLRHFRLDWSEDGLVLRGHALTYYAKQLAQHAVMTATSLPIHANEIEVL